MSDRRAADVVTDALVRLAALIPGLWMLGAAFCALMGWPPPMLGMTRYDFPMWATPGDKFWVVPAMVAEAVCWLWSVARWWWRRGPLGDRGTGRR